MDKSAIIKALTKIIDPVSGKDLISSHVLHDVSVEEKNINITLALPKLNIEGKTQLNFDCIQAIKAIYPDAEVNMHLVAQKGTSNAQAPKRPSGLPQVKNIIAVASGKGGVGKSTVSVNLALGLKELGAKVGLIDADLYGPSIPTMLGLQGERPKTQLINGQPQIIPLQKDGLYVISIGFIIEPEQAVVLRGPRLGGIIRQFFMDVRWPELDYLIVDLPPGTGDIQLTMVQTVPVTGALLVTTPQQVAVADAVKAMNMFLLSNVNVPIVGVVENMSWFTPAELPENKYFLFGQGGGQKMAALSQSPLVGQIPLIQGIRESGDEGSPAILGDNEAIHSIFKEVAGKVHREVQARNENMAATKIVEIKYP